MNTNQAPGQTTAAAEQPSRHYFSLGFAKEHGVPEAIVAKFLGRKVRKSKNRRDGKTWFYDTVRNLAENYPYIRPTTMMDILKRLKRKKLIEVGRYNKLSFDRTCWYTVPQEIMDAVEKNPLIRVDLDVAGTHSICAGVLIAHMRHELIEKPAKTKKPLTDIYMPMSPAVLARCIPFSAKTIKRTLDKLAGWIVKHPTRKLTYTLKELVEGTNPSEAGTDPYSQGTKPNGNGTKPNEKWTNPYNNTLCKPLETLGSPFGKPFKEEPQASPAPAFESDSGRTDDRILAKGPASPQSGHLCSPSSTGIEGCAGHATDSGGKTTTGEKKDVTDEMDASLTYEQLKVINGERRAPFQYRDPSIRYEDQPQDDPGAIAISIVRRLSRSFVDSLPNATIRKFAAITDMDTLVARVRTLFLPHFQAAVQHHDSKAPPSFKTAKPTFFRASLEFVVNSIASLRDKDKFCRHSVVNLWPFIYDLELVMFRRLHEENEKLMREWYEENKKQHPSVDEAKEPDPDLAPAEKARVLRNALQARNAWGYIDRYGEYVQAGCFIFNQPDLDLAEKLFELNRGFSVSQLLGLIDQCATIHLRNDVPEGHDKHFHVRRGNALGFFLKHAPKIAEELGSAALNGWVPLPTEEDEQAGEPAVAESGQEAGA